MSYINPVQANYYSEWIYFTKNRKNRYEIISTCVALIIILMMMKDFLLYIESRPGVVINDPILNLIPPVNLTWLIFLLIYAGIAVGVILLKPIQLVFAMQLYVLVVVTRMAAMYLVPLEPPVQMILLRDPFVEFFGDGRALTRDLFFSGHTATLFVLFLASEGRWIKVAFLLLTTIVAIALLMQHVHYTIDVFVALIATYADYGLLKSMKGARHDTAP